ncbi:MAG: CDP-alcohol phosphatidyltransferase family protein [Deltaproteobacteria bacterium]|nr:CDP-alcohol phosphatidyltransferase family protein [Deltaproteobacteria bacterium]
MPKNFFLSHPLSKPQDGPVSRYFNRWFSGFVSRLLIKTNATPNQVSAIILLLSGPMLIAGLYGQIAIAGIILQIASILDGVDGEIARTKCISSKFGGLLDTVSDYWIDSIGILSLGLAIAEKSMLSESIILLLVALTVTTRLISQFVVKSIPGAKPHLFRDTRDVVTFLIFIGAILTEVLNTPLYLLIILLTVNVWRLDNMIYQMLIFRRA